MMWGESYPIVVARNGSGPDLLLHKRIPVLKYVTSGLVSRSLTKVSG